MDEEPHSARQFTTSRDLWWHDDYLDLLAWRLNLAACRSVLELGAGVGHWTAQLINRCALGAAFTAVDREAAWVERLRQRFVRYRTFTALQADIADLSSIKGTFDLVTCQTVLMHMPDVPAALAQMTSCLAPGGLLLIVEPNNVYNRMPSPADAASLTPAEYGELAAFWWAYEIGRERLGFGREWIAELLPKMIADCGFEKVEVFQNDRIWSWAPPYDSPAAVAQRAAEDTATPADLLAERDEARRFVRAAGLDDAAFESGWRLRDKVQAGTRAAIEAQSYSAAANGHLYIFAARRPAR
jgi:SAM-dependent methyltransferase